MSDQKHGYGVTSFFHLSECAHQVCTVFGRRPFDVVMLLETCCVETKLGTFKDSHIYEHGTGVMQIDKINFLHIQKKYGSSAIAVEIYNEFGIDISRVEYRELALNPLLSMIFARFTYWMVRNAIPETLEKRAQYWKQHYNTSLGKGTVRHYIASVRSEKKFRANYLTQIESARESINSIDVTE